MPVKEPIIINEIPRLRQAELGYARNDEINPMIILGIDPGYARCGYGLIKLEGSKMTLVDYGCFETMADMNHHDRLLLLHREIDEILRLHKPQKVGVETLFFSKNTKTALKVAEARGSILLTLAKFGIPLLELSPNQIKLAITGQGSADKQQIQFMVKLMLKLAEIPKPDDAADALAIAIATATWNQAIRS